jgi:hypothetical protein
LCITYLVARRVVLRVLFCKKYHVMPYICWTGLSYPHSNVPKPRLRSKVFRARTWGSKTPFPRCCRARRRSKSTNQPKQARSKAQLSPPRTN